MTRFDGQEFEAARKNFYLKIQWDFIFFNIAFVLLVYMLNKNSSPSIKHWTKGMKKQSNSMLFARDKTIFFIETDNKMKPSKLMQCSMESASKTYPEYEV